MQHERKIEAYSEEVRDILKEIPGSLMRTGLSTVFLIFFSIIVGSCFFTIKEKVSVPIIITTTNPPARIICQVSGRIGNLYVYDGQSVIKGESLALIDNAAELKDYNLLSSIIDSLDYNCIRDSLIYIDIPDNLILGELQDNYNKFYRSWENYRNYLKSDFLPQRIKLLSQQMEKQEQHYSLTLQKKKLIESKLEIDKFELARVENLLALGSVSKSQLEKEKAKVIQTKMEYTNFLASLKSEEINIINQKRSLIDLLQKKDDDITNFETVIIDNIMLLNNQQRQWRDKYLLTCPLDGKVTFTKYWSENHYVSSGDCLATIVPSDISSIICRAVVTSEGIGDVQIGQDVHIKLSGYPYMEHGTLLGKVSNISLVPDEEGYIVGISLHKGMISSYREQINLVQEMDGTAEIIVDEIRMINKFLNPLKGLIK